ncbi:MAG: exo-alpha-sialidase [Planctomycetes bacterium]|nr:exo-alpha-sialidase [Planctomycetota bacterium]
MRHALRALFGLVVALAAVGSVFPEEPKTPEVASHKRSDNLPRIQGGQRIVAASGEIGSGMFPNVLKLPNGEVVVLVRGGAPHIGAGGRIDLIRSEDGGQTWSKPQSLPKTSDDDRGPSIGRAQDGTLICMYRIYDAYDAQGKRKKGSFEQHTMLTLSHDDGRTWTKPREVNLPPHAFVAPFQRMVCADDGTILMPAYTGTKALVVRSRDSGHTWGDLSTIREGFNECAMLLLPSGRLLAAMRSKLSGLWLTFSGDKGYTWSDPKQITSGRRYPADLVLLPSGNVLVTYGRRHPPYGVECRLSKDGGTTWSQPFLLAWTATNADCGYPSAVTLDDGRILMLWYAIGSVADRDLRWHCEAVRFREEDVSRSLP